MRILAVDYGTSHVGVAVSDGLMLTAQPLEVIHRDKPTKLRRTYARLQEICEAYQVGKIIVGLPLHMDGTEGASAALARVFAEGLSRRVGLETILWDERLTSVQANEVLDEARIYGRERAAVVDKVAAGFILQDYLDDLRNSEH